jgi:hypothetical protein
MINLIPPKGHIALKHEYVLRVASVYAFLLAGVLAAATALMIPTYVLTSTQLTGARDEGDRMAETKQKFDTAFGEIRVANTVMAQLRKESSTTDISEVISEVVRVAPRGITFTTFQATREEAKLSEIQVQGTADSRIVLASFKNALEGSDRFSEAIVPISDLARDSELPFVVTVTLEEEVHTLPAS